jgi:hypothetical protein
VTATGGTGPYVFTITPALPAAFSFSGSTGEITGTPATAAGPATYTVTATDSVGGASSSNFSLTINVVPASTLVLASKALTVNRPASAFTPVTLNAGTGTGPYTYSIDPALPADLVISAGNGAISGTPTVTAASASYAVTITDVHGATTSKTFSLVVNGAVVATQTVASRTLTAGTAAAAFTPVQGSGGTAPLTYSISPTLPANLSLNTGNGSITGTPAAAYSATVHTVTVTDANGGSANNTFSLSVNGPVAATTAIASKELTAGRPGAFTPVTAAGGTQPYVFTVTSALPSGLSIAAATGEISGTPAAASGPTTFTIVATDNVGGTSSSTFSLRVNPAAASTVQVASKAATINRPVASFTPVVRTNNTGTAPFTFAVNPALPTGLTFSESNGSIVGTPTVTAVSAPYAVTITDAFGSATSQNFTLVVNPGVTATTQVASSTFTANTAITAFTPVTAAGGTSPLSFSVAPGLPGGLTMNAAGLISGTPSAASGSTVYTATATDANGATGTATFTILVNGPISTTRPVPAKVLTAGAAAIPFAPVLGAGGTAPYNYTIAPGLPSGFAFNATSGEITGTPAAALTTTTYTVTVKDTTNATATNTFTLTVNAALVANQAIATRALTAGTAAATFIPVLGAQGTPPYNYAVNPALPLPTNLTMAPATGAITGTPAEASGPTSFTVVVMDSVGATASNSFSLTVNVALTNAGSIASRTLTAGAAATPFTPLMLAGGTPAYTWSVAPALPTGLTLNATNGLITGTPAAALTATNFTITGKDSVNAQVTHTLSLTINGALATQQAVSSRVLSAGTAAAGFIPVTATGGTTPYAFAITPALPPSLVFNPANGEITGTPDAALALTTFTVTVTDAAGATSFKTFNLTVNGPLVANQTIPTKTLTATTAAVAFIPVTGGGGTAPYTYTIAPALPASLVLNANTGSISGTAAAALAATPFTVTVKDSVNATATNTFTLTVNPALATTLDVPAKILSAGAAAAAFTPVTAADGTPPYTYAVTPALPVTLALNPATGQITGTPGAARVLTAHTVTATDSVGATSSKSFNLTVNGAPTAVSGLTIANRAITAGTAAIPFIPLPVQGGTPPFTYSVNPGLPGGLALDPATGTIAGTATGAAASAIYVVTATDSVGAVVNHNLTLVVNAAPVATAVIPSQILLQNTPATPFIPVTVAGGTPPHSFAISPPLANGLVFAPATGGISGTPTVATGVVTHTVTTTDAVGAQATATFTLKINRGPVITSQPSLNPLNPFYLVGGTLTLSVAANGSPEPTYQWFKGTDPITGNASATTPTLVVPNLALADAGTYRVVVTNEVAAVPSNPVEVIVYLPPAFTTHPANQTITAGTNATFNVVVTGSPAPTLQWRRNNLPIPGATGTSLTLNSVPANGSGAITVVATNAGGTATSDPANLVVNPVAPAFAPGLPSTATAIQGRSFAFGVAINATPATFSATGLAGPGGTLAINAESGLISGVPANLGTFAIVITATNSTSSANHTLNLTVQAPPPVITSAAATGGRVGTAFSFTVVGTNAPTNYAATGLPAGLVIDAGTGVISGSPTAFGTFFVGLTATNASGSVSQQLVINIDPPLNAPVYSGPTTPSATQGVAFTFTPAFGTVTAPYALVGTLPTGLTFNAATGVISGTATQTGSFPVTLSATNAGGTTTVPLTIVINAAPAAPVMTGLAPASGRVGVAFNLTLTSTGTPAASSYSATGLPPGLLLNAGTGAITGTPTSFGSFEVQVKATNTVGTGPTAILLINVAPAANAPVITSAPVAPGQVGQAFNYALTANNSPTAFGITTGTLPAGLTLNADGTITGTPLLAAQGETRVWFNATAGTIVGLPMEVTFNIAPAPSTPIITSNATAAAQVGQPFQYLITAQSGTAISAYGATGRPAWLALDAATGLLSGIPTETTTTAIVISLTATNAGGVGQPKTLSLTVAPAPATPVITSPLTASGRAGQAFTYQISASESPTSYVATGLPLGLSTNPTTGAITGNPTEANTFSVTLRAANAAGLGAPSTLTLNIAAALAAPSISSAAAVGGQVGVAFSYSIVASNGPILSYGIVDPSQLPQGLALNTATGVISGTPVGDPRVYQVQLTATNAGGTSAPQLFSINLIPALGVPVLTTPLYASGEVGVDFQLTITATNLTGAPPYAPPILLDAVNLPPGLGVNPSTGVIQGRPTTAGTTVATLSATNAAGTSQPRDLNVTVHPALAAPVVSADSAVSQVGAPFTHQIHATNSPTSYELVDAPVWMTVNGTTGVIQGTPTVPGTLFVQLIARNAAGASSPAPLALAIQPAAGTPVVTSSRVQSGQVGVAMSFTVTVDPTSPAATFVATGLPAGLVLNPTTGQISGTPLVSSRPGSPFNVVVTPSNSNGIGAPVVIAITIAPNVTFN